MSRSTLYTAEEIAKLEHYVFPGGYSAHATRGECLFDADAARLAVNFGPMFFQHTKGAMGGQPLHLELWQAAIMAALFGWKNQDGSRRFRIAYIEIPRGNGKSTMCVIVAGILLYIDDEPGADIFSAAGTRDQAREVFGPFKMNATINPDLAKITQTYQNSITRLSEETGVAIGCYKAISADADFQHGGNPHGVIFDELHVQPNRDLWDVLQTGKIKRRQPLTVAITTAGFDRHSICYEQRKWAEGVREGRNKDETFLPVIYAADDKDDWTSPETWRKANPNLGVSIFEKDLAIECSKAQQIPSYENTFKRLHLNIWTEQAERWLPMDHWDACDSDLPPLEGEPCWSGLDMSTTRDVTAFAMVFRLGESDFAVLPHFWIPADTAQRRSREDGVPYLQWAKEGFVTLTDGNQVDHAKVRRDINILGGQYGIQEIAFDPWNAAQIGQDLTGDGFTVVEFRQGYGSLSGPSKELERLVVGRKIIHGKNPVLRWMAGNVAIQRDAAENIKPVKDKSTGRIDGIVATIMGLGRAMGSATIGSVYDSRGVLELGEELQPAGRDLWLGEDEDD
jgi:phage terminase large subunit-like protein